MGQTICIRLSTQLLGVIEKVCTERKMNRSDLIRSLITHNLVEALSDDNWMLKFCKLFDIQFTKLKYALSLNNAQDFFSYVSQQSDFVKVDLLGKDLIVTLMRGQPRSAKVDTTRNLKDSLIAMLHDFEDKVLEDYYE